MMVLMMMKSMMMEVVLIAVGSNGRGPRCFRGQSSWTDCTGSEGHYWHTKETLGVRERLVIKERI